MLLALQGHAQWHHDPGVVETAWPVVAGPGTVDGVVVDAGHVDKTASEAR